ncbi:EscU/YscU/HrcU family type III secretion system export apparatus switch protein [Thiomonas bhubaneswarensis]|uniref:Type III secretion system substrate exporter, FlhB-like n=1 Tax=Thiomonas bhubaneswarensis TaxID=339866 RepID=A0A0K6I0E4_9BURK|nr:EscU/YscU/HrcU family type III secretion system export apparatus switch protein [Thiomonas bhubaneswarensis]CUA96614.1 Type III secretion system substrate exporter, FlhB-like [Thiomonas bhubaneswarensis]
MSTQLPPEHGPRAEWRQAVALRYDADAAGAPQVVAKGQGLVAEAIVARAKEAGVYVHESPQLVQLLMAVDLDSQIPPALYTAVAELLAWLWRLEAGSAPPQPPVLHLPESR